MKTTFATFSFFCAIFLMLCLSCSKNKDNDTPPDDQKNEISSEGCLRFNDKEYEIKFVNLSKDTIIENKTMYTLQIISYDSLGTDVFNNPEDITWEDIGDFFSHLITPDASLIIQLESALKDTLCRGKYVYNDEGEMQITAARILLFYQDGWGFGECVLDENDEIFISETLTNSEEYWENDSYIDYRITLNDENTLTGYYEGNIDIQ